MDFVTREHANALEAWFLGAKDVGATDALQRFGYSGNRIELHNRAMGVGEANAGAKAVATGFFPAFYQAREVLSPVRRNATVIMTTEMGSLNVPIVDDTEEAVIVAENSAASSEDVGINNITLGAFKYHSKILKASHEVIEDGGIDFQRALGTGLGKRIARATNRHFTVGTGSGQPTGIVTGSTLGVTTATDTEITYDALVDLQHSLDAGYLDGSSWMLNFATLAAVRRIADDNGHPIYRNGILLDRPVVINNAMPSIEAESKPIIFGDLSLYVVREVEDVTIRNYVERYADYHQVGIAAILRTDGKLLDVNGVKHLAMAS